MIYIFSIFFYVYALHQLIIVEVWEGETLPLRPLSREHTGSYLCIANNSYPPLVSKRVRVLVQSK